MAKIYVTEPSRTGGVGAMGMRILIQTMRDAGHDVLRVHLYDSKPAASSGLHDEHTTDASLLPRPDAWFVSCLYPRQFVDLPAVLWKMGVNPLTEKRSPSDPLIAFGGQSMIAPEPVADFADVMALGDGEATGPILGALLDGGATRLDVMREVEGQQGFYVPSRSPGARFARLEGSMAPGFVPRDAADTANETIEVARGCKSRCAYCPIGWAGGTYRERSIDDIRASLVQLRGKKLNLFAPDFSSVVIADDIEAELERLGCRNTGADARIDATGRNLAERGLKNFAFGIDGLSERLRAAVGKPTSDDAIRKTMGDIDRTLRAHRERVGGHTYMRITMYMIVGYPGETDADADALISLLTSLRDIYHDDTLQLSVTHLQPVPHTPLQWSDARYQATARARAARVERVLDQWRAAGDRVWILKMGEGANGHEHTAFLRRAPREASRYLQAVKPSAVTSGAWRDVASKRGLDVDALLRPIDVGAATPWSHVDVGVEPRLVERAWRNYERRMGLVQ